MLFYARPSHRSEARHPTHLDFPDLPNTLTGMVSGNTKVPRLGAIPSVELCEGGETPALRLSQGRSGGPEDGGVMARNIIGAEDFIAVQMPLFKKNQPKAKPCR